jgi:hypothetical protein
VQGRKFSEISLARKILSLHIMKKLNMSKISFFITGLLIGCNFHNNKIYCLIVIEGHLLIRNNTHDDRELVSYKRMQTLANYRDRVLTQCCKSSIHFPSNSIALQSTDQLTFFIYCILLARNLKNPKINQLPNRGKNCRIVSIRGKNCAKTFENQRTATTTLLKSISYTFP